MSAAASISGRVACVTAAGQGIGRAIAEKLIAEGATVHVSDIDASLLDGLDAVSATGVDATNAKAVEAWLSPLGQIDVVAHAVGFVHHGSVLETTDADWRKSQSICLDSAFHVVRAAVPHMLDAGGSVILIASLASSLKGYPNRAAYGAAKGGVIGLMKACAADYLPNGIRFNAICPGVVDTPSLRQRIADLAESMGSLEAAEKMFLDRQPGGRFASPDEIASACAWLCSDGGAFVIGQTVNVDGGISI
ncbi:2-keto-3-deoxy-L-fuconate dehydrogenase [Litoreibacter meonggei]|uniref:2-keto-3-deoxy-L-fuconate dehydrogenase n=1 Tax=Litoreibacter meonggei TaxID=1049199 RepID=A0A497VBZ8_9RHOB|nr:SDR family oxidoreductase [Litoreibacter meonggei]RLJ40990.1 2-keto-3-deoxy-L-fuconate dehydrogenase [Litoreibacter meonggei]